MGHMRSDFEELKKAREIAKRQLEEKFNEVYR